MYMRLIAFTLFISKKKEWQENYFAILQNLANGFMKNVFYSEKVAKFHKQIWEWESICTSTLTTPPTKYKTTRRDWKRKHEIVDRRLEWTVALILIPWISTISDVIFLQYHRLVLLNPPPNFNQHEIKHFSRIDALIFYRYPPLHHHVIYYLYNLR